MLATQRRHHQRHYFKLTVKKVKGMDGGSRAVITDPQNPSQTA
ncbi:MULTISPECIES: hypothetical protein [unclassified Arthrobacter]